MSGDSSTLNNGKRAASPTVTLSNSKARLDDDAAAATPPAPLVHMDSPAPPTEDTTITTPAAQPAQQTTDPAPAAEAARGVQPDQLPTLAQLYATGRLQVGEATAYEHDVILNEKIILWKGDITTLGVDLIVNAANKSLLGGGGVDGAIHSAAGSGLYDECKLLNGAETGEVKLTTGHDLPAKHIAHAVGPIYSSSRKEYCEEKLRSCYRTTLELAVQEGLKSVAFSGISTGIYGYPLDDATRTALDEVRKFLAGPSGSSISTVIFTVFRPIDVDSYTEYLPEFFPPPPAPTNLPVPASAPDPTHRPGPSPVGGAGVPPSAGADSDELAHADSVKEGAETTATAMSVDGERSQLVGVPKELASVKIGSVKEDESVETVVGDLPEKEAQEELV